MLKLRGKLAFGLDFFASSELEIHAGKKMYVKNLFEVVAAALSGGQDWLNESPHMKLALFQGSENVMLSSMTVLHVLAILQQSQLILCVENHSTSLDPHSVPPQHPPTSSLHTSSSRVDLQL